MTLNPFSSLQPPDQESENILQAKPAALDEVVEKAYRGYEGLGIVYDIFEMSIIEKQILSPTQIDSLLQVMISEADPDKLNSSTTGHYLSQLIQDSYYAGNNDFVLTTRDTYIEYIGYNLSGSKEKRLRICINGNAGDWCGFGADFSEITIYGNAGDWCGYWANNTKFIAHNEMAYDNIKYHTNLKSPNPSRGNTIRLVDSSGKVIKEEHL